MDLRFEVDASEFQERKRRRISNMNTAPASTPKVAPTSAPAVHEIATFLPGRLEFEHELDNEAEDLVKDLEFGIVTQYGGDSIPFDDTAPPPPSEKPDSAAPNPGPAPDPIAQPPNVINGGVNGHTALVNGNIGKQKSEPMDKAMDDDEDAEAEENMMPPPIETDDSIAFKLSLLDVYAGRVEKRRESKAIMFERGLLEYKKASVARAWSRRIIQLTLHRCKRRTRNGRKKKRISSTASALSPNCNRQRITKRFVPTQFVSCIGYHPRSATPSQTKPQDEAMLRKRIQELQTYRRLGLRSAGDIEKYDADVAKRVYPTPASRHPI